MYVRLHLKLFWGFWQEKDIANIEMISDRITFSLNFSRILLDF